jgi:hypothetical protein
MHDNSILRSYDDLRYSDHPAKSVLSYGEAGTRSNVHIAIQSFFILVYTCNP